MTKKSKIHMGMRKTGILILILILIGGCAFNNTGHEGLGEKSQPDPEMTPTPIPVNSEVSENSAAKEERPVMTEAEINRMVSKLPEDGIYYGSADGRWGEIEVAVTIENGLITAIGVDQYETPGLGDDACDRMVKRIIESQTTAVDTLGGATISSEAVIEAVNQALNMEGK